MSGGAAWGGGALGGLRLRKALSHLFFMLPAEDDDNLRSAATVLLSALAANNSLCREKNNSELAEEPNMDRLHLKPNSILVKMLCNWFLKKTFLAFRIKQIRTDLIDLIIGDLLE